MFKSVSRRNTSTSTSGFDRITNNVIWAVFSASMFNAYAAFRMQEIAYDHYSELKKEIVESHRKNRDYYVDLLRAIDQLRAAKKD